MYAMEYTKQERAAPAVITIVVHLALIYVFAAGMGVVPSPLPLKPFEGVVVPEDKVKPTPLDDTPVVGSQAQRDPSRFFDKRPPIIEIEKDPVGTGTEEPLYVGGEEIIVVEEPLTRARVLSSPEPTYPLVSRARDEEGTVFVRVMISPYGIATDVQLERSSGYSRLDEAAIKAVKGWRFAPAKRGSQAIATWVTVPVKFVLNVRG